jgi:hypothetical protein
MPQLKAESPIHPHSFIRFTYNQQVKTANYDLECCLVLPLRLPSPLCCLTRLLHLPSMGSKRDKTMAWALPDKFSGSRPHPEGKAKLTPASTV